MRTWFLIFAVPVLMFSGLSLAQETPADPPVGGKTLVGTVVRVIDGETMEIEIGEGNGPGEVKTVHLNGVNCPEKWEPFYNEAKEFTESLVLGKQVRLESRGLDGYNRLLAYVTVEEKSVGYELIKAGLAKIHSTQLSNLDMRIYDEYKIAQMDAMFAKKGMWSDEKN